MDATFSQSGDNPCRWQRLGAQYCRQMVTSRQVREALRTLRTDAKLTPDDFAAEAGVDRATVYRIEKMEKEYSPRVDTVSALVESRGLTLTGFFAALEGVAMERAISDPETEARVQGFRALDETVQIAALVFGQGIQAHLPSSQPSESSRAAQPGARTKSARGRRR